jgi:hypothetical protein
MLITDLAKADVELEPEHRVIECPHPSDTLDRSQAKFVGRVRIDADLAFISLMADQPMSRNCLALMPTYVITEDRRGGGPNRSKLTLLTFGGCGHMEKLVVHGAILPSGYYNQERLIHFQEKVVRVVCNWNPLSVCKRPHHWARR